MVNSERSYLEVKVTFQHVLILLGGVIIIGSFLFFLGYQAGKSSVQKEMDTALLAKGEGGTKEIRVGKKKQPKKDPDKIEVKEPSIREEIKLHQQPRDKPGRKKQEKKGKAKEKVQQVTTAIPVTKVDGYTIQVAAFNSHEMAKNYSRKFIKRGYPASISQATVKGKLWYRVRVGSFDTRAEANREKSKLEKLENKKFRVIKSE